MVHPKRVVAKRSSLVPVIDLFAGPGGLGEGFSAANDTGATSPFRIALSIEKDSTAHQTLSLRAFFRQFRHGDAPPEYYSFVRGATSRSELEQNPRFQTEWGRAKNEAWNIALGDDSASEIAERVKAEINGRDSVLIGGPPCQAYSLVGRSRNMGIQGYDPTADGRHTLYREYLKVVSVQQPLVFVMENVKGLLSARLDGESIFRRILDDLREPSKAILGRKRSSLSQRYQLLALSVTGDGQSELFAVPDDDPSRFVVRCEEFGIPQARHRLILIGVRADIDVSGGMTLVRQPHVPLSDVISDLPPLRSGISGSDDSPTAWVENLRSAAGSTWIRSLKKADRRVADAIEKAVSRASRRKLTRGLEFVSCEPTPIAHAEWYADPRLEGVVNHTTRTHMPADLHRYLFASAFASVHKRTPALRDFPTSLLPDHRNVKAAVEGSMFGDRFRVQLADRPSTTITSHISKDGHYYIHPDPSQCRSLTAREAARLQTFPDNYFFCGGRTAQYHQIGNAVPPLIARQIAKVVAQLIR